jgi:hypothetical protein
MPVSAEWPSLWMLNDPCTYHIHIDVNHALNQVIVCGDSSRMIPVLPESTFSAFTAIEFLTRFTGDQLNRFRNRFIPVSGIIDKKVNMILRDYKIQNAKPVTLFGLKQPVHPPLFILCKL